MRVILEAFSGRPNPTWVLPAARARELRERCRHTNLLRAADVAPPPRERLGFRGLLIREDVPGELGDAPWPRLYRLENDTAARADSADTRDAAAPQKDTLRWLLDAAREAVSEDIVSAALEQVDAAPGGDAATARAAPAAVEADDAARALRHVADCPVRVTPMRLSFWNRPAIQPWNNCYNYAANFVSNTLAQPGRRSGFPYRFFDCGEIRDAAVRDGLSAVCRPDAAVVALAVWPGFDFHWWRLHPGDFWAHKIGWWPAQSVDNSNRVLGNGLTPANCDRGPYTQFCGYYYAPMAMWVA